MIEVKYLWHIIKSETLQIDHAHTATFKKALAPTKKLELVLFYDCAMFTAASMTTPHIVLAASIHAFTSIAFKIFFNKKKLLVFW